MLIISIIMIEEENIGNHKSFINLGYKSLILLGFSKTNKLENINSIDTFQGFD